MLDASLHILSAIKELLYVHDCVILPGWGAFIKNPAPAYYVASSSTFFPPYDKITFNPKLQHNDGLLYYYLMEKEQWDYAQAQAETQQFILSLQDQLQQYNTCLLEGIGTFYREEGTIFFEQEIYQNFSPYFFGLKPVHIMPLPVVNIWEETSSAVSVSPSSDVKVRKPNWKYLAAAAALAAIVSVSYPLWPKKYTQQAWVITEKIFQKVLPEPRYRYEEKINMQEVPLSGEEYRIEDHFTITDIKQTVMEHMQSQAEDLRYHVVAGCFRKRKNAEKLFNQLRGKGFNASIIGKRKGLYTVVYGSFVSKEEAKEYLFSTILPIQSQAWVLEYERKESM